MQSSHSAAECFEKCKYKYKLRYVDKLRVIDDRTADNALNIGTALHTGIEKDTETAIAEYYAAYPIVTDQHVTEAMRLETAIAKAREVVPEGEHEVLIETEHFKGYIDLLVPVGDNVYDIWDFKYSNNIDRYMDSRQLHLYKYYFEKTHPNAKINKLYFLFVPKNMSRQKKTETLLEFRKRALSQLAICKPQIVEIPYDPEKVIEHLEIVQAIQEETQYERSESKLCDYCDYKDLCQKGLDHMILPNSERRPLTLNRNRRLWIYGAAFSGKTTMLDGAPNPLNLNTDGNINFVTMPYLPIKDDVTVEGRITKRKLAWDIFKESIDELEKKQNDFDTIIVDLLEDTYESCRLYMYDKLGISHESDDSFRAWDKVRTEFLSTIRRLINLDYQNIVLISHEDTTKDITKKSGDKITAIKPNIAEKVANKIAGMVDIVARVVVEDDGERTLNFKQNEVIFGGGRLSGIKHTSIPLSWDALMKVYDEVSDAVSKDAGKPSDKPAIEPVKVTPSTDEAPQSEAPVDVAPDTGEVPEDKPKRTRRTRKAKD